MFHLVRPNVDLEKGEIKKFFHNLRNICCNVSFSHDHKFQRFPSILPPDTPSQSHQCKYIYLLKHKCEIYFILSVLSPILFLPVSLTPCLPNLSRSPHNSSLLMIHKYFFNRFMSFSFPFPLVSKPLSCEHSELAYEHDRKTEYMRYEI